MGEERLALRGFPLSFLIIPFEAHLPGSSKHRGAFVGLWCRCRVVVPAPAVLPLRGALPFREPTPPKPSTTTRRGLDFLGSSLFSPFLSFFLSIHPPLPHCSFLPSASFFLFPPLSPSLLSIHPPTLPPLPSIDSRPLATLSSAILCLQLLYFSRSRPCPGTRKESESAGHPRNTSITIFYKSLMCSVVTTAARRAFGEPPAAASCSRRAA